MRTRFIAVCIMTVMMAAGLFAEEKPNKFLVKVDGKAFGTEEYVITKTNSGFKLKSKARSPQLSQVIEQEQILESDLSLKRYTLQAAAPDGIQTIEASREKDKIRMSVRVPNKEPKAFSVPFVPRTVVLDNMVLSHFQVLLDNIALNSGAKDWGFLVPQQLTLMPGGVTLLPRAEQAQLDGQAITVRKYSVNAGGLIMEMWADPSNARLMRVWVPTQKIEFLREGYLPPGSVVPADGTPHPGGH